VSAPFADLRVMVLDAWDQIPLRLSGATSLADLKREALGRARVRGAPEDYEVKYNGARLEENGRTLAELGLPPNAAVILLARRRRPAR
jgi:hypothetical protein